MQLQELVGYLATRAVKGSDYFEEHDRESQLSKYAGSRIKSHPETNTHAGVRVRSALDCPELRIVVEGEFCERLKFHELYGRALKLDDETLFYEADISYDPNQFISDGRFDIRAFDHFCVSVDAKSFSTAPFLQRQDEKEIILLQYKSGRNDSRLILSAVPHKSMWKTNVRNLAVKYPWRASVSLGKEDFQAAVKGSPAQKFSRWRRFKRWVALRSVLNKEDYAPLSLEVFGKKFHPSYEGEFSLRELENLENSLQTDFFRFIKRFEARINPETEYIDLNKRLKELADSIRGIKAPGTAPGEVRITKDEALKFIRADIAFAKTEVGKIPLSSRRTENWGFGMSISNDGHSRYFQQMEALTGLDMSEPFEQATEEYRPKSKKDFDEFLEKLGINEKRKREVGSVLDSRKDSGKYPTYPNGYLTIREIYNLATEALQISLERNPDETLGRYLELYRDAPTKVEITGLAGGGSIEDRKRSGQKLPEPRMFETKAEIKKFRVSIGGEGSIDTNYVCFEGGRVSIGVDLSNPAFLPVQEYTLEILGVSVEA